ncbi:MAG: efflux RND transporter periplasmic adaptor subunit [Phycisphaerales bacterium]|nr:MAG: efflux RND transporter periplasmic adaptor subunit [Phycisphaerales bacterium]
MRKSWVVIVVVVLIVAVVVLRARQAHTTLDVLKPQLSTIRAYVEEQAVTELPHDYLIAMPINGWLMPISLREGDMVAQGTTVARLDTADLEDHANQARQRIADLENKIRETEDNRLELNALEEAEATVVAIDKTVEAAEMKLIASKAVADFAASEVNRLERLQEAEAAADRETREAITELRKADAEYRSDALELAALKTIAAVSYIGPKFIHDYIDRKSFTKESYATQLEEARAALQIDMRNLARAEIKSPIDGVVLRRHQTRRQFLSAGTPLLTIGRLEELEVTAEILTELAPRISPGSAVEIFGEALPGGPLDGEVLRVYPAGFKKISSLGVEQQRVTVAVKPAERTERLGVGFRVYVRIFYDQADNVLILPRTAMFRGSQGDWQVMVVRNYRTELQRVDVGLMNDENAEIRSGLTRDDLVVARPSREIVPGMRVETTVVE